MKLYLVESSNLYFALLRHTPRALTSRCIEKVDEEILRKIVIAISWFQGPYYKQVINIRNVIELRRKIVFHPFCQSCCITAHARCKCSTNLTRFLFEISLHSYRWRRRFFRVAGCQWEQCGPGEPRPRGWRRHQRWGDVCRWDQERRERHSTAQDRLQLLRCAHRIVRLFFSVFRVYKRVPLRTNFTLEWMTSWSESEHTLYNVSDDLKRCLRERFGIHQFRPNQVSNFGRFWPHSSFYIKNKRPSK